jgi:hypothetical protein
MPASSRVFAVLTLALSAGGVGLICGQRAAGADELKQPTTAQRRSSELKLFDVDGKPFDLQRSSNGSVRVIVFIRSDCPISNRYAPEIRSLYDSYHSKGVDFYLVYVDPTEKAEAIREHLREYKYPCTGVRDPEHTLVAATGATVTPEAVVFNRQWKATYRGRVNDLYVDLGTARPAATRHDLKEAIVATLAGAPVAEPVTKAVGCTIHDLKTK